MYMLNTKTQVGKMTSIPGTRPAANSRTPAVASPNTVSQRGETPRRTASVVVWRCDYGCHARLAS